jgi:hypothetical protein
MKIRFEYQYVYGYGTWAVIDNANYGLPYAWFVSEEKAKSFCESENNNYYFPW